MSSKKVKVLSLDISSTCTGYTKFIVNGNTTKHEETSHIKPKGKDMYTRLVGLDQSMKELGLYEWPDICVIEGFAFAGSKIAQMGETNGIIKYNLTLNKTPFVTVAPTTVKKQITGNGRAKKEEVRKVLEALPIFKNIVFKNEDESDSAALGLSFILKEILNVKEYTLS